MNTDTKSYLSKTPEKCLQEAARAKEKMYTEALLQQRRHFLPFLASIYGIMDVEAAATVKRIPIRLGKKWQQPYLRMCGYINIRIAINLVRATHRCIRVPGYRYIGSACNAYSWRTAMDLTSSNRHAGKNPIPVKISSQVTQHRFQAWQPKPTQYVKSEYQK